MKTQSVILIPLLMSGCAGVDFNANQDGAVYYEPLPYLFYSVTEKCVSSVTVVSLPGKKRYLGFKSGYGASSLSAEFSGGLLTKVGQTSDTKIPETLASIAGLATAGVLSEGEKPPCTYTALLFPIQEGVPNLSKPLNLSSIKY